MGIVYSVEEQAFTERDAIMQDRGRELMNALCNAIQVDPNSEHVVRLVAEYQDCEGELPRAQLVEEREQLLKTLRAQYLLEIQKDKWNDKKVNKIKTWIDKLTITQGPE